MSSPNLGRGRTSESREKGPLLGDPVPNSAFGTYIILCRNLWEPSPLRLVLG